MHCGKTGTIRTDKLLIRDVSVGNITEESATISWQTTVPATSKVVYGTNNTMDKSTQEDNTMVTEHTVELLGLKPNTEYKFKVISKDEKNNEVESNIYSFKTDTVKTSGPIISNINILSLTSSSATIYWETDVEANSRVDYGLSDNYSYYKEDIDNYVLKHYVTLTDLNNNQIYHYKITSSNKWGYSSSTDDMIFQTKDLGKLILSPEIINVNVGDSFEVKIELENVEDVFSVQFQININRSLIKFENVEEGDLLKDSKYKSLMFQRDPINDDEKIGYVATWTAKYEGSNPVGTEVDLVNMKKTLCILKFKALQKGETTLLFNKYRVLDAGTNEIKIYEPNAISIYIN